MDELLGKSLDTLNLGVIGTGRLGTALAWSLSRRGLRVAAVSSRTIVSAQKAAAPISHCVVVPDAQALADCCDLVLIATPDRAIGMIADAVTWRAGMGVVHCSAASEVDVLDRARAGGASIGGFHPLQTFGDPEAAVRSLPGSTITIEAGAPLDAVLCGIAERLECRVNRLPPGMRSLYHAVGGYASQFINVLLREASTVWQSWGATEEDAVRALLPLVRGTIASIERAGLAHGMPGPVSRGDVETVAKHVVALGAFDARALAFYRTLCERTVPLAIERGGIEQGDADRIYDALGTANPSG